MFDTIKRLLGIKSFVPRQLADRRQEVRKCYHSSLEDGSLDLSNPLNPLSPLWIGNYDNETVRDSDGDSPADYTRDTYQGGQGGESGGAGASGHWNTNNDPIMAQPDYHSPEPAYDPAPSYEPSSPSYDPSPSYDSGSSDCGSSSSDSGSSCGE